MNDEDIFVEALLKLNDPHQSCAALRLLDEFSYREIAEIMQISIEDVVRICIEAEELLRDLI